VIRMIKKNMDELEEVIRIMGMIRMKKEDI
jgi:hypothetical protein